MFADRRRIYPHRDALKVPPHALPHLLPPTCTADVTAADSLGAEVAINKVPLFFTRSLHPAVEVSGQIKTHFRRFFFFHSFFSQGALLCLAFFPPAAPGRIDPVVLLHRHRFVFSKCQTSALSPEGHKPNVLQTSITILSLSSPLLVVGPLVVWPSKDLPRQTAAAFCLRACECLHPSGRLLILFFFFSSAPPPPFLILFFPFFTSAFQSSCETFTMFSLPLCRGLCHFYGEPLERSHHHSRP